MPDQTSDDFEKLLAALDRLLGETIMHDQEEADAILNEAGYDLDVVNASLRAVAQKASASSPLNWRVRAKNEIEEASRSLDDHPPLRRQTRHEVIAAIKSHAERHNRQVAAHFRNLDDLADSDLESMLSELEYLEARRSQRGKD